MPFIQFIKCYQDFVLLNRVLALLRPVPKLFSGFRGIPPPQNIAKDFSLNPAKVGTFGPDLAKLATFWTK